MPVVMMKVTEIRERCPIYKKGDKIVIDGARIDLDRTDNLCIHALPSLLHYAVALREGIDPRTLGLSSDGRFAYIQCLDPGNPYTKGGTVIFRCHLEQSK